MVTESTEKVMAIKVRVHSSVNKKSTTAVEKLVEWLVEQTGPVV